jgi:hypothetical protein
MYEILFNYQKIHAMNWVYLSSLLTIALYFKFSRFWSVRNVDLIGLILFAPGLVLVAYGRHPPASQTPDAAIEQAGFIWLFAVGGLFLIRMLMDSAMVRRPLLEPNLSVGGMTFLGVALLVFLMANVANSPAAVIHPQAEEIAVGTGEQNGADAGNSGLQKYGPRNPLLALLPTISTQTFFGMPRHGLVADDGPTYNSREIAAAKSIAILSHLAIVMGMVVIGYQHFDNIKTGMAAAVLYLLLPYTAEMTGRVDHALPAALLVWSIVMYRRPMISGLCLGLACGVIYYPLFLLPLWISFYWQRGLLRFCSGTLTALFFSVGILALYAYYRQEGVFLAAFFRDVQQMLGLAPPKFTNLEGFWNYVDGWYRVPVIATFVALGGSFALWPAQKNLGTLLSGTAAMMLGTQFWHAHGGGLCMAWYLPLLLLAVFRPNLEDRVALTVLDQGWLPRRRLFAASANRAA